MVKKLQKILMSSKHKSSNIYDIEVAYAASEDSFILDKLKCAPGTTAIECVKQSCVPNRYSELDLYTIDLGVFGEKVEHDYIVQDGDRIEIYRPLIIDPKQARRIKAKK